MRRARGSRTMQGRVGSARRLVAVQQRQRSQQRPPAPQPAQPPAPPPPPAPRLVLVDRLAALALRVAGHAPHGEEEGPSQEHGGHSAWQRRGGGRERAAGAGQVKDEEGPVSPMGMHGGHGAWGKEGGQRGAGGPARRCAAPPGDAGVPATTRNACNCCAASLVPSAAAPPPPEAHQQCAPPGAAGPAAG